MKLIFIVGSGAVGKMTVGQSLMEKTDLRLFHNHMTIEPVIDVFGYFDGKTSNRIREVIFEEFARSQHYGLIFTYMWAFDDPSDWNYIEKVRTIFEPYNTEYYCVELLAPQEVRLARNETENRLRHKSSKRDLLFSQKMILTEDKNYRLVSQDGELPFENVLRIDNTNLSADDCAEMIVDYFGFTRK